MKFSILITSYNKEQYIEECIKSCLEQGEKNFEVILFDNDSEDNSNKILIKYSKFIKLVTEKKISEYPAINQIDLLKKAYKISSGEIICLLDGDDYFLPNKLSEIEKKFLKNKDVDVIFDKPLIKDKSYTSRFVVRKKLQSYIWPNIIPTSSISFKKKFMIKCINENLFENYNLLEIDFRINVFAQNILKNFLIIDDPVTIYRKVDNSIMSNIAKYSKIFREIIYLK